MNIGDSVNFSISGILKKRVTNSLYRSVKESVNSSIRHSILISLDDLIWAPVGSSVYVSVIYNVEYANR